MVHYDRRQAGVAAVGTLAALAVPGCGPKREPETPVAKSPLEAYADQAAKAFNGEVIIGEDFGGPTVLLIPESHNPRCVNDIDARVLREHSPLKVTHYLIEGGLRDPVGKDFTDALARLATILGTIETMPDSSSVRGRLLRHPSFKTVGLENDQDTIVTIGVLQRYNEKLAELENSVRSSAQVAFPLRVGNITDPNYAILLRAQDYLVPKFPGFERIDESRFRQFRSERGVVLAAEKNHADYLKSLHAANFARFTRFAGVERNQSWVDPVAISAAEPGVGNLIVRAGAAHILPVDREPIETVLPTLLASRRLTTVIVIPRSAQDTDTQIGRVGEFLRNQRK